MVYWPVSSSLIGITLISSFLAVLALCTFQNLLFVQQNPIEVKEEEMITKDKEMTTKDKDLFESSKVSVKQEKDKND